MAFGYKVYHYGLNEYNRDLSRFRIHCWNRLHMDCE